ncbi:MAG TPA: hypothetical protein VMH24_00145 [Candidatus Sulfotelmatobacter sp.]|nr:hypothetical protein [Candidatus Sulfotelmatobacter sp.]
MARGPVWVPLLIGAMLALVGLFWIGQGLGFIPGSFMSGNGLWAVIGLILGVVGALIAARAVRARRPG